MTAPVVRPVRSHGWVPRPDIGPNVWEMPDGMLYKAHPDEGEPRLATLPGLRSAYDAERGTP